jgi:hypothetical protein
MKLELFAVIYKTTHTRCNKLLQKSDYRIITIEDLKKIQKESKPLRLFCSNCLEEAGPTIVDVILKNGLGVKSFVENLPIEKFA